MIGDTPERILLGTIDTATSADWNDWRLLPGPRVLEPMYWYENQNKIRTSEEKAANDRHRISGPRLLLDEDTGPAKISGLLFYCVQGERKIATTRLSIDLGLYHNATLNRDHGKILPEVLDSTSLATKEVKEYSKGASMEVTDLLVTGVGRIGTTTMCTLLRALNIMVSHDNDVDCGPYPGPDGAVSWLDAFKPFTSKRRYKYVIHMVRDPLQTINSRITKCVQLPIMFYQHLKLNTWHYEEFAHNETCSSFAIKNWVRRNSFVERHASWRVLTESVFSDPLTLWELCMAAGFAHRCPELSTIGTQLKNMSKSLNSQYPGAMLSKKQEQLNVQTARRKKRSLHSWESLANVIGQENYKYIQIAQSMAIDYGYKAQNNFTPIDFHCKFTGKGGKNMKYWDCFVG